MYKREGSTWKAFYQLPGPNLRNKRFAVVENEQQLEEKPASANQITSMRHETTRLVLENHHAWLTEEETVEETHFDPYTDNLFENNEQENPIKNAFEASKNAHEFY